MKNGKTDKHTVVLSNLKTESSYRTIPMDNRLIEILKWHRAQQNKVKKEMGEGYNELDLVFCGANGKIRMPATVGSRFIKLIKKIDIPYRSFHQLRHTFASVAISQGQNIKAISAIMGHSKTSMTYDVYTHALRRPDREAAEKLDALFNKSKDTKRTVSKA